MCRNPKTGFAIRLRGFIDMAKNLSSMQQKAEGRYDLPLNRSGGSKFIVLLIALMTFLAVLALSASFALGSIAKNWSSGLENKLTIEVPADSEDMNALKVSIKKKLDSIDNIKKVDVMSDDQISALVAPWLGEDFALEEVPMPVLIAVEVSESSDEFVKSLQTQLTEINDGIRIDTHEEWLDDFLSMIGSLKFATFFVSLVIGATAVTAITGVIRARMAEHKDDVELLHLMGASDAYIAGQFKRYALRLGLLGGAFGLFAGVLGLLGFSLGINSGDSNLFPSLELHSFAILTLLCLPLIACALCAATAQITVLRRLSQMP